MTKSMNGQADINKSLRSFYIGLLAPLDRHKALVERIKEIVDWARECEDMRRWVLTTQRYPRSPKARWEILDIFYAARVGSKNLLTKDCERS